MGIELFNPRFVKSGSIIQTLRHISTLVLFPKVCGIHHVKFETMTAHAKLKISNALLMPVGMAIIAWAGHQIAEGRLIGRGTITTAHESPVIFWMFLAVEILFGSAAFFIGFCATFNLLPGFTGKVNGLAKRINQFSLLDWLIRK